MATKYSAKGLGIQVEIATVFTTVASVTSLDGPGDEVQFWDATALDSEDIEDGELVDMLAPGEVSGSCFLDDADPAQEQLFADVAARGAHRNYQLILPTSGAPVMAFEGSVKNMKPKGSVKGGLEADFAIKLRSPAGVPA